MDGGVTSSDQAFNANVKKSKKEKVNVVSRIQGQYNSNRQHLNAANLWTYYLHFAPSMARFDLCDWIIGFDLFLEFDWICVVYLIEVDIMDIGPLELAQQISLLDQELMNRIQPNELKTAGMNLIVLLKEMLIDRIQQRAETKYLAECAGVDFFL